MRGALAQVCQDAARLLREGQAARAYSGLVAASRTLPMTPRLAAVLVRHALRAGTEREVISLLDAAMVAERGEVRREVRRQLSRVLRRSGQEARAAAVLNGLLLMDAPGDARARFVMDVLRERVAKGAPSRQEPEDDESRTKTVEVSALALSDPERGNTVLELPMVPVEVVKGAPARAARADTVQVPLGEWAAVGRAAARGPEFPWEDEGPGRARAVTPAERAVASPGARDTGPVDAGGNGGPVEPADGAATQPVAEEEAPEAGRADAALSFHSTEFPFVTGDFAAAVSGPAPSAVPSVTTLEVSPTVDVTQETLAHPGSLEGGSAVPPSPLQQDAPVADASPKDLSANSTVGTGSSAPGDSASTEAVPPNEPGTKSTSAPDSTALRDAVLVEAASAKDLDAESIAAPELSSSLDALAEGAATKDLGAKSTVAPEQPSSPDVALEVGGSSNESDAKSTPAPGQSSSVDAALAEVASSKESEAKPTAAQEQPSSLETAPTAVASEKASEAKPTAALQPSSMLDAAPTAAASAKESEAKSTAAQEQPSSLDAARTEAAPAKDLAARSAAIPNPAAQPEATASGAQAPAPQDSTLTSQRGPPRLLDSVLVPGAPSKAFDEDEPTSEMIPPRPLDSVLVPGAPSKAFDEDEPTSEITPPARSDAETDKDASGSTRTGDKKSRTKPPAPSLRRTTVLVPAASNPAFDEEESTSEVVVAPPDAGPPQAATPPTRDSGRFPSVKPTGSGADADAELAAPPAALTPEEGAELARSQRQESLLIARQAWRELAQLYLKRADRAKAAPERAEALTRLAEVMENELQDSAGAARMYREIVELTGERTALREQVRLLSQREDASIVRRALDDAIQRARTSRARAIALLTRGERLLNMGSRSKAREDFEAADALVPGLLPVLAGLVRCASDKERAAFTERLRAACAATPRRAPDRLDALRVLAQTAEESLGDLRIAQWAWAEVLAESPDNEQPREHLLALARRLGDLPALSQLLHAQLAREPRGPAARKAHLERVATLEAMGDAGAALAELRQAVRFEPGHKEAWLLLAERCIEREQLGEAAWAMENAATATESDEERQRTWERLALFCREVLHNTERARIYARRAESLRKAREDRARPPPPEPPRTAPPPAPGVPPPSVLVAPPVATGLIPASRKDLSDEVTANTDVPSMNAAEEDATSAASAKRSARAKDGAAPKSAARVDAGAPQASPATGDLSGNARASSAAPDAPDSIAASRKARSGAKPTAAVKAPSGSHASVAEVATGARKSTAAKAPSGKHASVAAASPSTEASRRSESAKAPSGSPPSLAESAPGPSATARTPSAKAARGTAKDPGPALDTGAPIQNSALMREAVPNDEAPEAAAGRKPRAPAPPPRERTTAFGAPLSVNSEHEAPVPSQALSAPPTPSAVSRKAANPPATSGPRAPARDDGALQPPSARTSGNAQSADPESRPPVPPRGADPARPGTQVREAVPTARPERAPRVGHVPRAPLSASGVEPPAPAARAPLSASGVEPPAAAPRAMAGASRPVAPPSREPPPGPTLDQIPDEDEDSEELGGGRVEATSVIAWEAPPGRMDPVRRIHRAGRTEGTVSGPAPVRPPPAGGRPTVGAAETRETPLVPEAPPADATSAEPIVFKLVRERPLDPKPYRGLVEHFDQRKDLTRAALMRELADALEGRDVSAPRVQRAPLTSQERAGLRHPGLRTPAGELLACVGIALCRLFPSPARIASTTEPLRASAGPGAAAILDALHTVARLLGVPLPELVAGDDDTANITPLHTTAPRLVVGRLLVQQPPSNAELRFHAGRALFSLSPDLLALRALRKDHLLRALALLSSVLKDPKGAGDDARVVREALSPKALERASALMEPGTRDFDASLLSAAARDSANRAGLVACGGPGPALTALRARRPHDQELEELVRFAASERYLALRDPTEAGRGGR